MMLEGSSLVLCCWRHRTLYQNHKVPLLAGLLFSVLSLFGKMMLRVVFLFVKPSNTNLLPRDTGADLWRSRQGWGVACDKELPCWFMGCKLFWADRHCTCWHSWSYISLAALNSAVPLAFLFVCQVSFSPMKPTRFWSLCPIVTFLFCLVFIIG